MLCGSPAELFSALLTWVEERMFSVVSEQLSSLFEMPTDLGVGGGK